MESIPGHEEILQTSNTKLAAILLVFGGKLRKRLPLEWDDVYASREAYLEHLEDPRRSKPKTRVTYNFEPEHVLKEIVSAYQAQNAEDEFRQLVKEDKAILAAYSRAVVQACREALEAREFLFKLRASMPENAKWDVIDTVRVGKNSSDELRAEYLNKI